MSSALKKNRKFSSYAQDSRQDFIDEQAATRAEVGVGPMTWSRTAAAYAQKYADEPRGDCDLKHSGRPYGKNLVKGYGVLSSRDSVKMWAGEKDNYDYCSNSCVGGECLHNTQVVWRNSVRLGCARVKCDNGRWSTILPAITDGERLH
ncbi:hypothetical protein EUGRSUZ_C00022 [Eucalyptus grandis]|uniref:Uncharacterized protein n=2 Tax=Eucalyptus grandis TaxID=71139 RepID=A0ACC3LA24_EUCGR|nr:hypothetical protein EUGRSUZ_C00022 [Eucalyptus grandis]